MGRRAAIAAALALAAASFAAGAAWRSPTAPIVTRETTRVMPMKPGAAIAGPSLDDIRAVVRAELAQLSAAPETRGSGEPAAPSPQAVQVALDCEQQLDGAIAAGAWRDEDRQWLRTRLPDLSSLDRDRLLSRFAVAVNSGTLQIQTAGTPL